MIESYVIENMTNNNIKADKLDFLPIVHETAILTQSDTNKYYQELINDYIKTKQFTKEEIQSLEQENKDLKEVQQLLTIYQSTKKQHNPYEHLDQLYNLLNTIKEDYSLVCNKYNLLNIAISLVFPIFIDLFSTWNPFQDQANIPLTQIDNDGIIDELSDDDDQVLNDNNVQSYQIDLVLQQVIKWKILLNNSSTNNSNYNLYTILSEQILCKRLSYLIMYSKFSAQQHNLFLADFFTIISNYCLLTVYNELYIFKSLYQVYIKNIIKQWLSINYVINLKIWLSIVPCNLYDLFYQDISQYILNYYFDISNENNIDQLYPILSSLKSHEFINNTLIISLLQQYIQQHVDLNQIHSLDIIHDKWCTYSSLQSHIINLYILEFFLDF